MYLLIVGRRRMLMNEQKEFVDSKGRKYTAEELKFKHNQKKYQRKIAIIASILSLFIIILGIYFQKIKLSEYQVDFKIDIVPVNVVYDTENGKGHVNTEFNIEFEGKKIESIVVSCSKDIIKREELSKADAYFIEYSKIEKTVDYKKIKSNDKYLGSVRIGNEEDAMAMLFIGNSCTIDYGKQNDARYGLNMNVIENDNGKFAIKELILDVTVNYLDGTTRVKKIKIDASENVLSGINAHL